MLDSATLLDEMRRCTDDLDLLIAQGLSSTPSHSLSDLLADGARTIARRLDEAARGKAQPAALPQRGWAAGRLVGAQIVPTTGTNPLWVLPGIWG